MVVKRIVLLIIVTTVSVSLLAQRMAPVKIEQEKNNKTIKVYIDGKLFTSFLYPDTLEKPVLYPIYSANGTMVTRGFPWYTKPGDPDDHPHHLGYWFNYESVNGLDFWNNSYAIPAERKNKYGWIKTDKILQTTSGATGTLSYHANWTNQQNDVLLEETTRFEFSGLDGQRIVDRITVLKAATDVTFKDVKDGMIGLRVAHELQIPSAKDQKFTDDKGNVTVIKVKADSIANGNYLTSEGKQGDDAWSTRAAWCKMYGKMGNDSISIVIMDHPSNPNYPTFWHARGYGLFAANPLGEKVFTNGKSEKNLQLKKGESVSFYYRLVIGNGQKTLSAGEINKMAEAFGKKKPQ